MGVHAVRPPLVREHVHDVPIADRQRQSGHQSASGTAMSGSPRRDPTAGVRLYRDPATCVIQVSCRASG
jgi:hypothetical protein